MKTIQCRFWIALFLYFAGTMATPLLGRDLPIALLCTMVLGLAFVLAITAWVLNVPTIQDQDRDVQPQ